MPPHSLFLYFPPTLLRLPSMPMLRCLHADFRRAERDIILLPTPAAASAADDDDDIFATPLMPMPMPIITPLVPCRR